MASTIHAISDDLKPAPNESLRENPNTLRALKPLKTLKPLPPLTTAAKEEGVAEKERLATTTTDENTNSRTHLPVNTTTSEVKTVNRQEPERMRKDKTLSKSRRWKLFECMEKDHFLYLNQAYQFSTTISHSRLQLIEKKGKNKVSDLFVPQLLDSGLGVKSRPSGTVAPKHFIISPLRANNISGPGKGIHKFTRFARVMLLQGSKFVGNQTLLGTAPAMLENRRWKFNEERLVVRYDPQLENLKLYVEFNFQHQLTSSDKLGLGLDNRNATAQVTEATVAWCTIPVSICSQIKEETVVPVKLMTGSLSDPVKLDDLRNKGKAGISQKLNETCGASFGGQVSCFPQKQSLFTLKVSPMAYSEKDFRYLPSNFLCNVKFATVLTLYQMILRESLKEAPSFLNHILDPVLVTFQHILNDEMMKSNFLNVWDRETKKIEQTKDKLFACFRECTMRFWPLVKANNSEETYDNDFNSNGWRNQRISTFVSEKAEDTLKIGGHTWSHKPFTIQEISYCLGDYTKTTC